MSDILTPFTPEIEILDTTLRDGAQSDGISFSVRDKLDLVRALDDAGISIIEAGNPGAVPKDMEVFHALKNIRLPLFSGNPPVRTQKTFWAFHAPRIWP